METVRIRDEGEFPPEMQRVFAGVKRWFRLDFVPKMNRVTAYDPGFWAGFGRCGKRAMAEGALPRDLKEMIAVGVSAINACEYWIVGHTAAGKLLGRTEDDVWYEVAYLVGTVHGMNGVADGLRLPPDFTPDPTRVPLVPLADPAAVAGPAKALFEEVAAFFAMPGPPNLYRALAHDPAYAADHFRYVRHVFSDGKLPRPHKCIIALAVSMASRSSYGIDFHHREARRLGLSDAALWELVFVTEQFNAVNKIGACLHLQPDMYEGLTPKKTAAGAAGTP